MNAKQKRWRNRIIVALVLFVIFYALELTGVLDAWFGEPAALYVEFVLFLIPFLIAGYDVLITAARKLVRGHGLDESFLMSIATLGAFALIFFPDSEPHMAEGAAVMLFYQVGELFQSYAVGKSRKSISDMMDIAPEYANIMVDGELEQVDPYELSVGDIIVVKPGERIPIDGIVENGESRIDTSALTGESVPRTAHTGDEVISGCVNLSGTITVKATSLYENSTVSRILELVENAAEKKAKTENFITRFARVYTPVVVGLAAAIAFIPPIIIGLVNGFASFEGESAWADWILRGLTFLVVSCPCALVISVPLSFFGGIGGASKAGILVKGSNYLELLSKVDTVVFDKTGTLTSGTFTVTDIVPANGFSKERLLEYAAHAEAMSNHPIAVSVQKAFDGALDLTRVTSSEEKGGHGIKAMIDGDIVLVGNDKLMYLHDIDYESHEMIGTQVHVAVNGDHAGTLIIGDTIKEDSAKAIADLHAEGVREAIMLTGDNKTIAQAVAERLGLDGFHAGLLPEDKVNILEAIMEGKRTYRDGSDVDNVNEDARILDNAAIAAEAMDMSAMDVDGLGTGIAMEDPVLIEEISRNGKVDRTVAFVGDGINDAPVLTRADVGIAMGAMGSDAAIEAADIVLMDDKPTQVARAIRLSKRTMRIVWQNIVFALGIKFAVLILAAFGIANMWMAVFADVGVAIIAILNAMRAMRVQK